MNIFRDKKYSSILPQESLFSCDFDGFREYILLFYGNILNDNRMNKFLEFDAFIFVSVNLFGFTGC